MCARHKVFIPCALAVDGHLGGVQLCCEPSSTRLLVHRVLCESLRVWLQGHRCALCPVLVDADLSTGTLIFHIIFILFENFIFLTR